MPKRDAMTKAELVEEVNKDPRRGVGHEKVLTRLELDHQAERLLSEMGYSSETVPAEGEVVGPGESLVAARSQNVDLQLFRYRANGCNGIDSRASNRDC